MNGDEVAQIVQIVRMVFDLLPQLCDVHVYGAREREAAVTPHRIEQFIARDDCAAMFAEMFEDAELARRKVKRLIGLIRFKPFEADRHVADGRGV